MAAGYVLCGNRRNKLLMLQRVHGSVSVSVSEQGLTCVLVPTREVFVRILAA